MILLLAGLSHTGKTKLSQQLMERLHIPYMSMDHIKMGLIRGYDDCGFQAEDSDALITPILWPVLKGILLTALENKQSLIMEGCYLPLDHMKDFPIQYHKQIVSLYLGFSTHYIKNHYQDIIKNRNVIEQRLYPFDTSIEELIKAHEISKIMIIEAKLPYFEIQSDYKKEIDVIINSLSERITKQ